MTNQTSVYCGFGGCMLAASLRLPCPIEERVPMQAETAPGTSFCRSHRTALIGGMAATIGLAVAMVTANAQAEVVTPEETQPQVPLRQLLSLLLTRPLFRALLWSPANRLPRVHRSQAQARAPLSHHPTPTHRRQRTINRTKRRRRHGRSGCGKIWRTAARWQCIGTG